MGQRPLGPAWLRRLTRITGLDVIHASGSGGHVFCFTTADHVHGWYDLKANEWHLDEPQACTFSSCRTLFPQTIDRTPSPGGH